MRISELSRRSGVTIPTIKFYLREDILHPGTRTARNQAAYDESHLRRLHLVRVLSDVGGLGLAAIRGVIEALERRDAPLHETLAAAHVALAGGEAADGEELRATRAESDAWLARRSWRLSPESPSRDGLATALLALRQLGWEVGPEVFERYADHADALAADEIAYVAGADDPQSAVEATVIGTVVFERAFAALRRLAQEHHSRTRLG